MTYVGMGYLNTVCIMMVLYGDAYCGTLYAVDVRYGGLESNDAI